MKRKLVAALACRNQGSRLYGKPLQNLDIEKGISILEYMIQWLRTVEQIDDIVLGISVGSANLCFIDFAKLHGVDHILGDEHDVLLRLIQCGQKVGATDIFRLTTESPFTYFEGIAQAWKQHVDGGFDCTFLDNVPDGSGVEIHKLSALEYSHDNGQKKHRSEMCSLYIRENKDKFKINNLPTPDVIRRPDIRLTVDYPEDLILCRKVYEHFKELAPRIPLVKIIEFLDQNPSLKELVEPFVAQGLKTMYL